MNKTKLYKLSIGDKFSYKGRTLQVLQFEGTMVEVIDNNGKPWAWPTNATVVV